MTNDEMRVAIAKACGWRLEYDTKNMRSCWISPKSSYKYNAIEDMIPDYPNDLNAMNEVEKTITEEQWPTYRDYLHEMAFQSKVNSMKCRQWFRRESCTAAQRAEAFLRTLGLWRDA